MAVTRQTLAEVLAQKDALRKIGDVRTGQLVAAWVRAWDSIAADLETTINQMMADALTGTPSRSRALRLRQQRRALRIVSDKLAVICRAAGVDVSGDAARLIRLAGSDTERLIRSQLPTQLQALVNVSRADAAQIEQIVTRTTEQITVRTYALHAEAERAMRRQLSRSLAVGDSPREAARRMLADVKGAFDGGLTRALVIARTEIPDAYRRAAQTHQDANADLLTGWQWVATLGPRTCPSCLQHHGEKHPLDDPGPLDHHQGRCARMPVTKSWSDLGFPGIPETSPALKPGDGVRWFGRQAPDVQRGIMGPDRWEAWRQGVYPPGAWSQKRTAEGWRDSYGVGPLPKGWTPPAAPPRVPPALQPRRATTVADWPTLPGPESMAAAVTRTNPKWMTSHGYQVNCSSCVVAVEARVRGFDVTAGPRAVGRMTSESAAAWLNPTTGRQPEIVLLGGRGKRDLATMAKDPSVPDGARGMIRGEWAGGGGHIWSWEKLGNDILMRDGQASRVNVAGYLDRLRSGSVALFRVDDCDFVGDPGEYFESLGGVPW